MTCAPIVICYSMYDQLIMPQCYSQAQVEEGWRVAWVKEQHSTFLESITQRLNNMFIFVLTIYEVYNQLAMTVQSAVSDC